LKNYLHFRKQDLRMLFVLSGNSDFNCSINHPLCSLRLANTMTPSMRWLR